MIVLFCVLAISISILVFDLLALKKLSCHSSDVFIITPIARKIKNNILLSQRFSIKEPQRVRFKSHDSDTQLNKDALNYYVQHIKAVTNAAFVSLRFIEVVCTFPEAIEHTLKQAENAFIPWLKSGTTAVKKKEVTKNSISFGLLQRSGVEVLSVEHIMFSSEKRGILICGFKKESHLTFENEKQISEIAQQAEEDLSILSSMYHLLERLNEASDTVRRKETSLKFFSHDMKSPLHNLSLILDSLKDETSDKDIIEAGMRSLTSAQRVVEGILRPEETESKEVFSISSVLRDVHAEFIQFAQSKGLFLELHDFIDESVTSTNVDELRRVIQNFVSNALKYTQKGGVTLSASLIDSNFILLIKDTGIGMTHEELLQFGIIEGRYKKDIAEGDGIGAMSAMRLINKNQWNFKIESEMGRGTVITLSMPL